MPMAGLGGGMAPPGACCGAARLSGRWLGIGRLVELLLLHEDVGGRLAFLVHVSPPVVMLCVK